MSVQQKNALTGEDMTELVKKLRRHYGQGKKIALFGDNATINKGQDIRDAVAEERQGWAKCKLIYNLPYRPDLSKYLVLMLII